MHFTTAIIITTVCYKLHVLVSCNNDNTAYHVLWLFLVLRFGVLTHAEYTDQ